MNLVVLIGRNVTEGETRYSQAGNCIYSNKVAVESGFKNQEGEKEVDFIPYVVFGKQAENVTNYTKKGSQICVKGRMRVRSYDGQDGQKRWITEVVAENVRFLSPKDGSGGAGMGASVDYDDEEIPF